MKALGPKVCYPPLRPAAKWWAEWRMHGGLRETPHPRPFRCALIRHGSGRNRWRCRRRKFLARTADWKSAIPGKRYREQVTVGSTSPEPFPRTTAVIWSPSRKSDDDQGSCGVDMPLPTSRHRTWHPKILTEERMSAGQADHSASVAAWTPLQIACPRRSPRACRVYVEDIENRARDNAEYARLVPR